MPLEIEIKLKMDSHEPVREVLRRVHGQFIGTVRETNIFFDRPDRELRKKDSGLRVRLTRAVGKETQEALLTFKGPAAVTGLRSREAYDLQVTPADQLIPLVRALGFEQVLLFEKDRESWLVEGCRVELDTLPHFGTFLEIEGPSEEAVKRVQGMLGLDKRNPVTASYSKMVGEFLSGAMELKF